MKYGARAAGFDKSCLFKRTLVDINYEIGCHKCHPTGVVKYSDKKYKLYHYIFINEKFTVERYKANAARLSLENLKNHWSRHYLYTAEQIHDKFSRTREKARKLF
jgi:hypothetical protein